jgi:hypothetical protein
MATADRWKWTLGLFAAGNLAMGLWMLVDPPGWYLGLPAAVPDTGPLNEHFVRDVGSAFTTMGLALAVAALRPGLRLPALAGTTVFYALHAAVHVTDTLAGRLPASHWAIDFPGVYLPVLLLVAVIAALRRSPEGCA